MEFSEANGEWRSIPQWVHFLIRFGYGWPPANQGVRRIALVSMPCDSAAAGLVTLGAMIRDLGSIFASEANGHATRLAAHAAQYLRSCGMCDLDECDPALKGCGLVRKVTGILRRAHPSYEGVRYFIKRLNNDPDCPFWILPDRRRGGGNQCPTLEELRQFYIDGEAPIQLYDDEGMLNASVYEALVPGFAALPQNLQRSYSGVCLAGRSSGEIASRTVCASIALRYNGILYYLDELLSIRGWTEARVSRVCFFNSRAETVDPIGVAPSLVVADGDNSFLKVLSAPQFQHSDVVGVIHRAIERDRLESLGAKIQDLSQWYAPDEDMLCGLPSVPRGISISILRRAP